MKKWILLGGIIIVLGVVVLLALPTDQAQPAKKTASKQSILPIKIAEVNETEFADFVEAVGSTFAYESAEITSNVTEVVEKINFQDGQRIKKEMSSSFFVMQKKVLNLVPLRPTLKNRNGK